MTETQNASENPIIAWLKKYKFISWTLAFLTVVGGAVEFGGKILETTEKALNFQADRTKEIEKRAALNGELTNLASAVVRLAMLKGYNLFTDHGIDLAFSDARLTMLNTATTLQLSTSFKDADYSEPKPGVMNGHVIGLADAISATHGVEAGKTFLFSYWMLRAFWDLALTRAKLAQGDLWATFIPKVNDNRPPGIEPLKQAGVTQKDFCTYYFRNLPLSVHDTERQNQKQLACPFDK